MRRLTLVLVLAGILAVPAAARAVVQTAHLGQVTASFSYKVTIKNGFSTYSKLHLTITRGGVTGYDAAVTDPPSCGTDCWPGNPGAKQSSVRVIDLAGSGEPNIVLDLYTGGAHCCFVTQVFSYRATTNAYVMTRHDFGDPGYRLKRLTAGGPWRFETSDDNFADAFTSFAQSGLPIQILGFANGKFTDVTRQYPALIKKDASFWWRLFQHHLHSGTGALAAWAADEELLHRDKLVQSTLQAQLKAGHLVGGFINGKAYIKALNKLLHKLGYR